MKFPRNIPQGFTMFGMGIAITSTYLANRKSVAAKNENTPQLERTEYKQDQTHNIIEELQSQVSSIQNKSHQFINDFKLSDITTYYDNLIEYYSSFDIQSQILVYNSLNCLFLLSLFNTFLMTKYANYLLEKLNNSYISIKYPKLSEYVSKLLRYRLIYQNYYFKYLTVLGITSTLMTLIGNLLILFT